VRAAAIVVVVVDVLRRMSMRLSNFLPAFFCSPQRECPRLASRLNTRIVLHLRLLLLSLFTGIDIVKAHFLRLEIAERVKEYLG
jgi:hypothetical protein